MDGLQTKSKFEERAGERGEQMMDEVLGCYGAHNWQNITPHENMKTITWAEVSRR